MGKITIQIPCKIVKTIEKAIDVVSENVPFFIGLGLLDKYNRYVFSVQNILCTDPFNVK